MNVFDFVNSVTHTKDDLMKEDPSLEKQYVPYVVNKALSQFVDTLFIANEINLNGHLDNRLQYSFFLNIIRKKRRFAKWHKNNNDDISAIQEYYRMSHNKAVSVLPLLSGEQLQFIKDSVKDGRYI